MEISARAGVPAIVTNNHKESEVLFGRNLYYKLTGRRIDHNGVLLLEITLRR